MYNEFNFESCGKQETKTMQKSSLKKKLKTFLLTSFWNWFIDASRLINQIIIITIIMIMITIGSSYLKKNCMHKQALLDRILITIDFYEQYGFVWLANTENITCI